MNEPLIAAMNKMLCELAVIVADLAAETGKVKQLQEVMRITDAYAETIDLERQFGR